MIAYPKPDDAHRDDERSSGNTMAVAWRCGSASSWYGRGVPAIVALRDGSTRTRFTGVIDAKPVIHGRLLATVTGTPSSKMTTADAMSARRR